MSDASTHLLVANPTAQSGKNAQRIDAVRQWMEEMAIPCGFLPTLPGGRTIASVADALNRHPYRVVIAMGGDGTFREVASGILTSERASEVALGMLPTGTANDQGRSFGLLSDDAALEENLSVIAAGRETRLDGGFIRSLTSSGEVLAEGWFFDSAGWGISARILAVRNQDRSLVEQVPLLREVYRDKLVYAGATLRVFLQSYVVTDKFTAHINADGHPHQLEGLTDLVIKGTRIYGGAWVLDRNARHDDGLFEVVPFRGKRDWASKAMVDLEGNPLTEEMLNSLGISHSRPFPASHIDLAFEVPMEGSPLCAQIDGEEFPAGPRAQVQVHREVLRLIVP